MIELSHYHPRHLQRKIAEALQHSPVVLIQEPRQCCKTYLSLEFLNPSDNTESSDIDLNVKAAKSVDFHDFRGLKKLTTLNMKGLPEALFFMMIRLTGHATEGIPASAIATSSSEYAWSCTFPAK